MTLNVGEQNCRNCVCLRPHGIYGFFAVCSKGNKLMVTTPETRACGMYRRMSAEELKEALLDRGSLYCLSCGKPLFLVEELNEHLEHVIGLDFCADNVAWEEAPPAS